MVIHIICKPQQEYDYFRTKMFNEFGLTVIRFKNEEDVLERIDLVLEAIRRNLPLNPLKGT